MLSLTRLTYGPWTDLQPVGSFLWSGTFANFQLQKSSAFNSIWQLNRTDYDSIHGPWISSVISYLISLNQVLKHLLWIIWWTCITVHRLNYGSSLLVVVQHLIKTFLIWSPSFAHHLHLSPTDREWTYGSQITSVDGFFCNIPSVIS